MGFEVGVVVFDDDDEVEVDAPPEDREFALKMQMNRNKQQNRIDRQKVRANKRYPA